MLCLPPPCLSSFLISPTPPSFFSSSEVSLAAADRSFASLRQDTVSQSGLSAARYGTVNAEED